MRVDLLTREYPPHIYGGAGVHAAELSAVLRNHIDIRVRCFDGPRTADQLPPGATMEGPGSVTGYGLPPELAGLDATMSTLATDLLIANDLAGADLIHSHTWYANFAGHIGGLRHGIPHILSAHSLEPLRPWKAEQLGGGYAVSSWAERTAYLGAAGVIAVSGGMRNDILRSYPEVDPEKVHVVHNGIDTESWARPEEEELEHGLHVVKSLGIDPDRPTIVFVGRITRQKGLSYFLQAVAQLPDDVQVVLCAGAPDTPQIMQEISGLVAQLREDRGGGVIWIEQMLPRPDLVAVLAHADVFACPSIYEPLGIVNLEAMAVGLPVVGTATGGIPEVVVHGETGLLVPIEQVTDGTGTPLNSQKFVEDLAAAFTEALSDPERLARWGVAARQRVEDHFAWTAVAERTLEVYNWVLNSSH